MAVTVVHGNCIEVMRKWKENSVDAIVCDPPYGLEFMGKEWDSFSEKEDQEGNKAQTDKWGKGITGSTLPRPAGKQNKSLRPFQQWCEEWGREALRILKPGGHILAFSGTRTYHRLACGLEDAGFVVRDSILWLYGCLSDDSEALTRRGWVRGPELRDTDEVLQWDATTGAFAWVQPSRIVIAPYAGPLVRLANRHTDQLLTPNHRVYARVQRHTRHAPATAYEVLDAEAVGNRSSAWRVTLPCAGTLTEGAHVDPDYAYLVGWWLTDAWAHGDGKACMFSQSKPETLARLRKALAPYAPSEYVKTGKKDTHADEHTFYLTGPIAERLLTEYPDRHLSWDVLGWSLPARQALYRGLMDGDGSQPGAQYAHTFWSKNADRRDVFLALATTLGFRSFIGDKDCVFVNTETETTEVQGKHRVAPVDYNGLVWCVTVPTGAFLARRNGRPFVTGNSGFPKSLDVSKAIGKAAGAEGEITGAPVTDDAKQWEGWGTALKPAHEPILVARKPIEGTIVQNIQEHGTGAINIGATRIKAGTNQAGRWPANVVLSHTPQCECVGTRAVYAGTGKADYTLTGSQGATPITKNVRSGAHYGDENGKEVMENWVCPPNCPVRALDEQTADLRSGTLSADCYTKKDRDNDSIFAGSGTYQHAGYEGDAGGASRFFYCAKASRSEREAGLTGEADIVDRTAAVGRGMAGLKCRKCQKWKASGNPCQCSEPDFEQTTFVRPKILNTHPTVKPIRLMEYLLTLVTPKGGVALDPFCGSGTTLVAAVNLGINCIGIEQDAEYVKIAKARVEYAKNNRD